MFRVLLGVKQGVHQVSSLIVHEILEQSLAFFEDACALPGYLCTRYELFVVRYYLQMEICILAHPRFPVLSDTPLLTNAFYLRPAARHYCWFGGAVLQIQKAEFFKLVKEHFAFVPVLPASLTHNLLVQQQELLLQFGNLWARAVEGDEPVLLDN